MHIHCIYCKCSSKTVLYEKWIYCHVISRRWRRIKSICYCFGVLVPLDLLMYTFIQSYKMILKHEVGSKVDKSTLQIKH